MDNWTTSADTISQEAIEKYRRTGFLRVRGIVTPEEAAEFRQAAEELMGRLQERNPDSTTFRQFVNVWTQSEVLKKLTLHSNLKSVAAKLAGVKLRLWHDHLLVKEPKVSTPTEFHQDQPYWPHANSTHSLSCWVALNDVPVERGCMTFIPGSHRYTDLMAQNLKSSTSLFELAPDLAWDERVTLPLKAGDCTFHHGRTAHMANQNVTDEHRFGMAIIYIDASTTYTGAKHEVIEGDGIKVGHLIDGRHFPLVS